MTTYHDTYKHTSNQWAGTNQSYEFKLRDQNPADSLHGTIFDNTGWIQKVEFFFFVFSLTTQDLDIQHPVSTWSPKACWPCVSDEMTEGWWVQFRCRHNDSVWTQMDSSSWQLLGPFSGLYGTKAERDLKCSLGQDQAESHSSLKPHKHKLAENKVTTETQALFKASNIPQWSQNRWKMILLEMRVKILQIHEKVTHWLFKDFNVFLLLWFSYLGSQWRLKNCFLFFCTNTVFVRTSIFGDNWICSSFVAFSGSCISWGKLGSILFFVWLYSD